MGGHRWRAGQRQPVTGLTGRLVAAVGMAGVTGAVLVGVASAAGGGAGPAGDRAADLVPGTPCSTTAKACVDLAGHQAWLIQNGQVTRGPVPLMDGATEDPTPSGTFKVEWKAEHWTSREYGTPMPYSVFFAPGGISFHEGQQDTWSAGCVKLLREDAVAWFNYLQVGDEVQVH